ncbi:MAG: hypothetical protein IPJ88_04630 [Myxococcales bacterium]|nr:MAG: hypothetical protein IPJ88_04630 [Myxococcales bacterium]
MRSKTIFAEVLLLLWLLTLSCEQSQSPAATAEHCSCPELANTQAYCDDDGACSYTCQEAYVDCDGDLSQIASNGCEKHLLLPSACGSCDMQCGEQQYCLDSTGSCQALRTVWANAYGGVSTDIAADLAIDADQNIYVTGAYYSSSSDNPAFYGGDSLPKLEGLGVFAASYDSNGAHRWSIGLGGGGSSILSTLALDASGFIYIGGAFRGYNMPFDSLSLSSTVDSDGNYTQDFFVAKLDANTGQIVWVKGFGGPSYVDRVFALAIDESGNCIVEGKFYETIQFGPEAPLLQSAQDEEGNPTEELVVAKLDGDGNHLWSKAFPLNGGYQNRALAIYRNELVIAAGAFDKTVKLSENIELKNKGDSDVFIMALDLNSGELQWANSYGGGYSDDANSIAINDDSVFMAGRRSFSRAFVGAWSLKDGAQQWIKLSRGGLASATGVAIGPSADLYVTGTFQAPITFGTGMQVDKDTTGMFVYRLSPDGLGRWIYSFGTGSSYAISADEDGAITVVGTFNDRYDFGTGSIGSENETYNVHSLVLRMNE